MHIPKDARKIEVLVQSDLHVLEPAARFVAGKPAGRYQLADTLDRS